MSVVGVCVWGEGGGGGGGGVQLKKFHPPESHNFTFMSSPSRAFMLSVCGLP